MASLRRNVIGTVARGRGGSGDLGSSWQQAATDLGAHAPRGGDLTSPHSSIADIDGEVCGEILARVAVDMAAALLGLEGQSYALYTLYTSRSHVML